MPIPFVVKPVFLQVRLGPTGGTPGYTAESSLFFYYLSRAPIPCKTGFAAGAAGAHRGYTGLHRHYWGGAALH
jgi:hypothetical protein